MTEQTLSYERYLASLPDERRESIDRVWQVVRESVPAGYTEKITPKYLTFMAGDEWYLALANQKNYISLHLLPVYLFPELKAKLDNSGKKLKMGKGCINFKRADELPLEAIAEIVGAYDVEAYKKHCRDVRDAARDKRKSAKSKSSKAKSKSAKS
ncbi:MAG TPA: DUF1801 domain-containing protein [Pyrinomonadaceae bacterium]|nr:DUF1801 domain-containing protein [Pyrinomonadaceae bacterium]